MSEKVFNEVADFDLNDGLQIYSQGGEGGKVGMTQGPPGELKKFANKKFVKNCP